MTQAVAPRKIKPLRAPPGPPSRTGPRIVFRMLCSTHRLQNASNAPGLLFASHWCGTFSGLHCIPQTVQASALTLLAACIASRPRPPAGLPSPASVSAWGPPSFSLRKTFLKNSSAKTVSSPRRSSCPLIHNKLQQGAPGYAVHSVQHVARVVLLSSFVLFFHGKPKTWFKKQYMPQKAAPTDFAGNPTSSCCCWEATLPHLCGRRRPSAAPSAACHVAKAAPSDGSEGERGRLARKTLPGRTSRKQARAAGASLA